MAYNTPKTYGTDIACVHDADSLLTPTTGMSVVAQSAYHRLTTDSVMGPGGLGWGYDCRRLIGMNASRLSGMQPILCEVLQRDDRILAADVRIAGTTANGLATVRITVTCYTAGGPFSFVVDTTDLRATTIEGQAR